MSRCVEVGGVGEGGGAVVEGGFVAFGEDGGEAELAGEGGDGVVVDEVGVAEGVGGEVEEAFEHLAVEVDLFEGFAGGAEGGEGVVGGFGEEFDVGGGGEGVEEVEGLGGVDFELFDEGGGEGERDFEGGRGGGVGVGDYGVEERVEEAQEGEVDGFGELAEEGGVGFGVEIGVVGVKDGVLPEAEGLVKLEVEEDGGHGGIMGYPRRKHKKLDSGTDSGRTAGVEGKWRAMRGVGLVRAGRWLAVWPLLCYWGDGEQEYD